jgi:hypothetical protein
MSSRRNSAIQSPLRRPSVTGGLRRKSVLRNITVDVDSLQNDNENDLKLRHLRPSFQKFWQVTPNQYVDAILLPNLTRTLCVQRRGDFSPRSSRLSRMIPQPLSNSEAALVRLGDVQGQVSDTIVRSSKVQVLATLFLRRYFELIPPYQVRRVDIVTRRRPVRCPSSSPICFSCSYPTLFALCSMPTTSTATAFLTSTR